MDTKYFIRVAGIKIYLNKFDPNTTDGRVRLFQNVGCTSCKRELRLGEICPNDQGGHDVVCGLCDNRHPIVDSTLDPCCKMMRDNLRSTCKQHKVREKCPDTLITIMKDGVYAFIGRTESCYVIQHCPWCGQKL